MAYPKSLLISATEDPKETLCSERVKTIYAILMVLIFKLSAYTTSDSDI